MNTVVTDWVDVLDAMEERVSRAERWLAGEDVDLDDFAPPSGGGSLPASLAGRARALMEATSRVETQLELVMGETALRVEEARGHVHGWSRAAERPAPSFIDRSA